MSTVLVSPEPHTMAIRSPLLRWLAVLAVMLGIFSIVTTEILPIGLLTSIGADFTISDGMAGLMMTMPGLLAAVAAPLITVAAARIDRKLLLCACTLMLVLANAVAAIAPDFWLVLVSRVLIGITIGGYWSIAAGLAGRLVPPESAARATAVIFSSVPLGSVLGVPAGTLVGSLAGWRAAFVVLGILSAGVLLLLLIALPPLPAVQAVRLSTLRAGLHGSGIRSTLLATFFVVLAQFGTYTYVTPFLEQVTGVGAATITMLLLIYGVAGILGNFLGGALVARRPRTTLGGAATLMACATLALPLLGRWEIGAALLLILWGIGYGAVPVALQTWFAAAVHSTAEVSSVLFTASFQATFSLGALVGGVIVDRTTPSTVMLLGGATALLVLVITSGVIDVRRTHRAS
ncbi:MFS transporter [Nocardia sp. NBC_01009]|uniref:MFS transporter n=1 Tax=Nocardia sp. NBC_01009 TaxID=2975996 RepID=UPI00386DCB26|nr:MFS transporter [Nocardia sp. NBC_01009]